MSQRSRAQRAKSAPSKSAIPTSLGKHQPKIRKPAISLVVAISPNRIIGFSNRLPWHLPDDLRHFRRITINRTVIMGRRTFDSMGRALPKRRNIVISRRRDLKLPKSVEVADSLPSALQLAQKERRVFVIGGEEIFKETLPLADRIHLTLVYVEEHQASLFGPFLGDRFFPSINPKEWRINRLGDRRLARIRRGAAPKARAYLNNVFFRFIDLVRFREAPKVALPEDRDFDWSGFEVQPTRLSTVRPSSR